MAEGQQIKCLTVIDEYDTRECLAIDAAGSILSKRVGEVPKLVRLHGALPSMRSANRPESVCHAITTPNRANN